MSTHETKTYSEAPTKSTAQHGERLLWAVIVVLAIVALWQFMEKKGLEHELLWQQSIAHVDLTNLQYVQGGRFYANITGFVAFYDSSEQPKDMRQYYMIEPTYDPKIYTIKEIFAMNLLPPRMFDPITVDVAQDNATVLVLVDESGNTWNINKLTKEVQVLDSTGDSTYLITDNTKYQDFMQEFLKDE